MGAEGSTTRLQALVEMGFSVVEARLALEATSGNVERAAELLKAHRRERERAQGGPLVARINAFLRNQQPWSEFFDKFLWPEHLHERIETNLLYYRANYAIICGAIVGISAFSSRSCLHCWAHRSCSTTAPRSGMVGCPPSGTWRRCVSTSD